MCGVPSTGILKEGETGRAGSGHAHQLRPTGILQRRQHVADRRDQAHRRPFQIVAAIERIAKRPSILAVPTAEDVCGGQRFGRID